jgi:hypothetical protein
MNRMMVLYPVITIFRRRYSYPSLPTISATPIPMFSVFASIASIASVASIVLFTHVLFLSTPVSLGTVYTGHVDRWITVIPLVLRLRSHGRFTANATWAISIAIQVLRQDSFPVASFGNPGNRFLTPNSYHAIILSPFRYPSILLSLFLFRYSFPIVYKT